MSGWTSWTLPNLNDLCTYDERLRQTATEPDVIRDAIQRICADAEDSGDDRFRISLMGWLTDACRVLGELDRAERYALAALDAIRNADGKESREIAALIRYGEVLRNLDRYEEAETTLKRAVERIDQSPGSEHYLCFAHQHLGKVYIDWGKLREARESLNRAESVRLSRGDAVDNIDQCRSGTIAGT